MTTDSQLDADEHYNAGERLRVCAEVASRENDFALAHDLRGRARLHYAAAEAACAIWPGRPADPPAASGVDAGADA